MKPKRQFITVMANKTATMNHAPMTIAVDTIAKIEDIALDTPISKDGVRSWIWIKGKDTGLIHCDETREAVLAKIEEPLPERSALLRLRLLDGKDTVNDKDAFAWLDVVAITLTRNMQGELDQEWLVRTANGLHFLPEYQAHGLLERYEEVS